MPSVSKKQHNFMAMAASAKGRAWLKKHGKKAPPVSVAKDYLAADKGSRLTAKK